MHKLIKNMLILSLAIMLIIIIYYIVKLSIKVDMFGIDLFYKIMMKGGRINVI